MTKVPKNLQGVLWSADVSKLDIYKNKKYIIHQVLAYGTLKNLIWLFKTYKISEIKSIFIEYPEKDYTERTFNFVQKVVLNIPQKTIDKRYYVKNYPRVIG
jgi:hypothetical protein